MSNTVKVAACQHIAQSWVASVHIKAGQSHRGKNHLDIFRYLAWEGLSSAPRRGTRWALNPFANQSAATEAGDCQGPSIVRKCCQGISSSELIFSLFPLLFYYAYTRGIVHYTSAKYYRRLAGSRQRVCSLSRRTECMNISRIWACHTRWLHQYYHCPLHQGRRWRHCTRGQSPRCQLHVLPAGCQIHLLPPQYSPSRHPLCNLNHLP